MGRGQIVSEGGVRRHKGQAVSWSKMMFSKQDGFHRCMTGKRVCLFLISMCTYYIFEYTCKYTHKCTQCIALMLTLADSPTQICLSLMHVFILFVYFFFWGVTFTFRMLSYVFFFFLHLQYFLYSAELKS